MMALAFLQKFPLLLFFHTRTDRQPTIDMLSFSAILNILK